MTAHPKFEEIAEFVFAKKIDAEYFRRAAQMNAHLNACPECRKIYEVMLTAADLAEALSRCATMQRESIAVGRGVRAALADLVQSGQTFLLNVRNFTEIVADGLTMYHPMPTAFAKSTGSTSRDELRSVLTDEEGNRIRIDGDGSLTMYFARTLMPAGQMVVLIPEKPGQQEMVGIVEEYDRMTTRVCFEGIMPGEFRVLLG